MTTQTLDQPAASSEPELAASTPSIPFTRLLRVEWRKSTDTRSARWLLGIIAVIVVGLMAVPLIWVDATPQRLTSYGEFAAVPLAVLLPVVAILTLTSEWTQRSVLTTFTQEPRRLRVFSAKVLAGLLLALAGTVFAMVVTTAALALSSAFGRDTDFNLTGELAIGFALFLIMNSALGVAFGAVLQNSAAAIVLFFVVPTVWSVLSTSVAVFQDIGQWLDTGQTFGWVLSADWDGHWAKILASTAVWIVLPIVAGAWRTVRREVT